MRMWLCNPKILCIKHLLGEHVEMHMFLGTLRKKIKVDGYIKNNLFEPLLLQKRHDELADELLSRKYNHSSTLNVDNSDLNYLSEQNINYMVDQNFSLEELLGRCPECKKRFEKINNENKPTN